MLSRVAPSVVAFGIGETFPSGLAIHPTTGVAYMIGVTGDYLSIVNLTVGTAAQVGSQTQFGIQENGPYGLEIHPVTGVAYALGQDASKDFLLVDLT